MADIGISFSSDERTFGGLPSQFLQNRFFEQNPTQLKTAAMLARPGTDVLDVYGQGPIRGNYAQPGLFNGALFTVSGESLYRRDVDGTVVQIGGLVLNDGEVSMTGLKGADFERLFIADGSLLQFYPGPATANGILTATPDIAGTLSVKTSTITSVLTATSNPAAGSTVQVGSVWYVFSATVGTAAGTSLDPFPVLRGPDTQTSLTNLASAINANGTPGTNYSSSITAPNPDATAEFAAPDTVTAKAKSITAASSAPVATTETSTALSWSSATLVAAPPTDGDIVQIGNAHYRWSTAVNVGSGTASDPWPVLIGPDMASALSNLHGAVTATGVQGTDYSASIVKPNLDVTAVLTAGESIVFTSTALFENEPPAVASLFTSVDTPVVKWGADELIPLPVADGDKIQIGSTWYVWKDVVLPAVGDEADPWNVLRGTTINESLQNMVAAINFSGIQGTTYSSNLGGANTEAHATFQTPGMIRVDSIERTAAANAIQTTVQASDPALMSWSGATLVGGGAHALSGIEVPDGLPPVSVATLKAHILVAIGDSDRFYWIKPGEVTIDGLDFATSESQPDDTLKIVVVGDSIFFVGEGSTEVWYPTGDQDTPFAPVGGRVFDQGAVDGTVVNVNGTVFLVGTDNIVYAVGGSAKRVSNHGIEQIIRAALGT